MTKNQQKSTKHKNMKSDKIRKSEKTQKHENVKSDKMIKSEKWKTQKMIKNWPPPQNAQNVR